MLTLTGVGQPQNGNLISDLLLALCARATYCENKTCSKDTLNEIKNVPFSPYVPVPFTISVKTDNAGTSNNDQFTIPWTGTYDVDWGDGNTDTGVTNAQTHTYATTGTYDVSVTAASGRIAFANGGDKLKLLNISSWGETAWTSMKDSFRGCSSLTTISATDVPLTPFSFSSMFFNASSLVSIPNLNNWDVSSLTNMGAMFRAVPNFNGDCSSWDVSSVTDMSYMFSEVTSFTGDISNWDVSSVTNFKWFLYNKPSWNNDLSSWDVSSATNMERMFQSCTIFNSDIGNWDVSNVTNMFILFQDCTSFDQDLSSWQISQVTNLQQFMTNVTLSTANYDALLIGWDAQGAMSYSGTVDFGNSQYTLGGAAEAARTSLIAKWGAIIDGGGIVAPFTISVKTDNVGTSNNDQFTIPWTGTYDVDWGDGNTDTSVVDAQTHTYATAGTYDVSVTAASGRIAFNNGGDKAKLLDIKSWGDVVWTTMLAAFRGCSNLTVLTATDVLICPTNLTSMFHGCSNLNTDFTNFNTSSVTTISQMFAFTNNFNGDITTWDTSNLTSSYYAFRSANAFNQNIGGWNTSSILNMGDMFGGSIKAFNQDISLWDVNQVTNFLRFMVGVTLSTTNYDALLIAWDAQGAMSYSGTVPFGNSQYTLGGAAEAARNTLTTNYSWIITDSGAA